MQVAVDSTKLQFKHRQLEEAIMAEQRRPAPDEALIVALKKQKLQIKDHLSRISQN